MKEQYEIKGSRCHSGGRLHKQIAEAAGRADMKVCAVLALLVYAAACSFAAASSDFSKANRAFAAGEYARAAREFTDLAAAGDARAQTYLGYMYQWGVGVPQNFMVSTGWYRCAAQQGEARAQYQLGLMYDKGQGVPQDYVVAYALLSLAVAGATEPERGRWALIRDAVASKLSIYERNRAQQLSFEAPPGGPCLPIGTGYGSQWFLQ